MLLNIIPSFPKKIWIYTAILYIYIARKTFFDIAKEVGNYSVSLDSGTFLAISAIACSFYILLLNSSRTKYIIRSNVEFILYYILALISFIWAGNFFAITFKALEVIACFLLVGIILLSLSSIKNIILYIIFLSTLITWSDLINIYIKSGFGFYHTNAYTLTALIGLLLSISSIKFKIFKFKELKYYIVLCLYGFIFGTSSASYISFLSGLILLFSYNKRKFNFYSFIIISLMLYLIYQISSEVLFTYIFYGKSLESIENGTGRVAIWEAAYKAFQANPILGGGFIIGERSLGHWGINGINVLSAHNTFISVLVNTGIIGALFFLIFLIKWIFKAFISSNSSNIYARVFFPTIIASLINCNSMPAIGSDWNYTAPCLYALIIVSFSIMFKLKNKTSRP